MRMVLAGLLLWGMMALGQTPAADRDEVAVTGRVVEEGSGLAINGATVEVFDDGQREYFSPRGGKLVTTLTADVNGEFSAQLKPGFYTLYAKKAEFAELNVGSYGGPKSRKIRGRQLMLRPSRQQNRCGYI